MVHLALTIGNFLDKSNFKKVKKPGSCSRSSVVLPLLLLHLLKTPPVVNMQL